MMTENKIRKNNLETEAKQTLLSTLEKRFKDHMYRHEDIMWDEVINRLENNDSALVTLQAMEQTKGEPDVVGRDESSGELLFFDCSKESPKGRSKVCYDDAALKARKKFPPETSALKMAEKLGIELLDETQYRYLQQLEECDSKTSSWIKTPEKIRALGGALFCDRRYDTVFVYHNGADSYYSSRGFRGYLKV
ncbi:Protein of unknown function [Alkalibacterium putridalgicola]|uniref:DUF4256 domain-containing protein n=2 Tax=Alkalibacterium putridalgicola TaxID=426703 RepID=A0A1H7TN22_9LACT|nr:Protein of unknown function [Alkalibacterium putridalgicola]